MSRPGYQVTILFLKHGHLSIKVGVVDHLCSLILLSTTSIFQIPSHPTQCLIIILFLFYVTNCCFITSKIISSLVIVDVYTWFRTLVVPAYAWRYYAIALATRFPDHYIWPRFCSGFCPVAEAIALALLEGFLDALALIGGDVGPPSSAGFIKDVRGYIRNPL